MNRSEIREQAFKLIYSLEIQNIENLEEQIELYIESNNITDKNAIEYIKDSVLGIKKNEKDIMQKIEINLMKREKNSMIRGRIHTDLALEAKERYEEFKQQFPQICQRN